MPFEKAINFHNIWLGGGAEPYEGCAKREKSDVIVRVFDSDVGKKLRCSIGDSLFKKCSPFETVRANHVSAGDPTGPLLINLFNVPFMVCQPFGEIEASVLGLTRLCERKPNREVIKDVLPSDHARRAALIRKTERRLIDIKDIMRDRRYKSIRSSDKKVYLRVRSVDFIRSLLVRSFLLTWGTQTSPKSQHEFCYGS